jgi:reactive intermediate/imine deaminase
LCAGAVALGMLLSGCAAPAPKPDPVEYLKSPIPNAPFSAAVRAGDLVFLSGQIGIGADGKLPADFTEQARLTMQNVQAALTQAGLSFDDVIKCTAMLADMSHWDDFNRVYITYFKPGRLPARSALGANGLARGAQVELECTAHAGHHP